MTANKKETTHMYSRKISQRNDGISNGNIADDSDDWTFRRRLMDIINT